MESKEQVKIAYDKRHGGPYDRGTADSYYERGCHPHFFKGATYATPEIEQKDMTGDEIKAYMQGYKDNEESGERKQW